MNLDEIIEQHLDSHNASGHLPPSNGIHTQPSQGWEPSNLVLVECWKSLQVAVLQYKSYNLEVSPLLLTTRLLPSFSPLSYCFLYIRIAREWICKRRTFGRRLAHFHIGQSRVPDPKSAVGTGCFE
jgi:hypothetical protein